MIILQNLDKVQVVSSSTSALDVHASWIDNASGVMTPGRTNTAIVTAATTDVVATPSASTFRNLKTLQIRNKGVVDNDVTVVINQNGTSFELHKTTLSAGEALEYAEGVGFLELSSRSVGYYGNGNTADVAANAADTYLTGSNLIIAGKIQAATVIRWRFSYTKTAAGVATPIFTVRVGTAGSVADTARLTFTFAAQTAATDTGYSELDLIFRAIGATGSVQAVMTLEHKSTTSGFAAAAQIQILQALSAAFDLTVANLIIGVSCNPGTSGVWTFQTISSTMHNAL
jgi:hypothetical protein